MNILEFIKLIDKDNSQNYKIDIIKDKAFNNEDIMKWIKLIYDDNINFYFTSKSLPSKNNQNFKHLHVDDIYNLLINMSERKYNKNQIIEKFEIMSSELADLFIKSLDRKLFVNVSNKILNKAYKSIYNENLFNTMPYMRCSLMDKLPNISYPAIAQLKSDGTFANILVNYNNKEKSINGISIYSRSSKRMELDENSLLLNKLKSHFKNMLSDINHTDDNMSLVFMGELLVLDGNKNIMDRQTGNGLITSLSKQFSTIATLEDKKQTKKVIDTIDEKKKLFSKIDDNIIIRVWDYMNTSDWYGKTSINKSYKTRFDELLNMINKTENNETIFITDYLIVNNYEEAKDYYNKLLSENEEGIILKNFDMSWKDGTSNDQIKFKEVKECDLLVTGFEMGSGQFKDGIGSLICESKDKKLKVNISGLTREMRGLEPIDKNDMTKGLKVIDDFDFNQYNNKIVSVEFNQLIKSRDSDIMSLFLPRILEVRNDKSEADTLDYIEKL